MRRSRLVVIWLLLVAATATGQLAKEVEVNDPPSDVEIPSGVTLTGGPTTLSHELDLRMADLRIDGEQLVIDVTRDADATTGAGRCSACILGVAWRTPARAYVAFAYRDVTANSADVIGMDGAAGHFAFGLGIPSDQQGPPYTLEWDVPGDSPTGTTLTIRVNLSLIPDAAAGFTSIYAESWYKPSPDNPWQRADRGPDEGFGIDFGDPTANAPPSNETTGEQTNGTPPISLEGPRVVLEETIDFRQGPSEREFIAEVPPGFGTLLANLSIVRDPMYQDLASDLRIAVISPDGHELVSIRSGESTNATLPAQAGTWRVEVDGSSAATGRVRLVAIPAAAGAGVAIDAPAGPSALDKTPFALSGTASAAVALLIALAAAVFLALLLLRRRRAPAQRYRPIRDLASGGFGRTWLAEDLKLKREVVIKELHAASKADAKTRAMLLREAQVVAKLSHPHVVTIHDVELEGPSPRIVMEYVEGGNLAERVARAPMSEADARRMADEVLQALERVHAAGVLHRDIKPANVLLTRDGHAKLADFGTARVPDSAETLAATGSITGTPLYMAPEQVRGEKADARTDLYAVGALLHEAATGEHYLGRPASLAALQRAILDAPPTLSPRLPPQLAPIVSRALAKDPAARYQSAAEMRAAIARVAREVAA